MRTESKKGIDAEIPVFRNFVSFANLPYVIDNIEKRNPPEPDILCNDINGSKIAFELVEICDSTLAKAYSDIDTLDGKYIRTSDPSFKVVENKLNKKYETPYQIELLCYTSGRIVSPPSFICEVITSLMNTTIIEHPFYKVWLLSRSNVNLLWPKS